MQSLHRILKVSVLRAYNLKDTHVFGKNHPYLKVLVDGVEQQLVNQGQRQVYPNKADDPVNPEFEADYEIPLQGLEKEIHVEVWGRELLMDSKLGSAVISLHDLLSQAREQGSQSIKAYTLFSEKHAQEVVGAIEVGASIDSSQAGPLRASLASQTKEETTRATSPTSASKLGTDDKHAGHIIEEMRPINVPLPVFPIRVGLVLPTEHKEQVSALDKDPNFVNERVGGLSNADEKDNIHVELEKRFQGIALKENPHVSTAQLGEVDVPHESRPLIPQHSVDGAFVHPFASSDHRHEFHSTEKIADVNKGYLSDLPAEELPLLLQPVRKETTMNTGGKSDEQMERSSNEIDEVASESRSFTSLSDLPAEEQPILVQLGDTSSMQSSTPTSSDIQDIGKRASDSSSIQDKTALNSNQIVSIPYELTSGDLTRAKTDPFRVDVSKDDVSKDDVSKEDVSKEGTWEQKDGNVSENKDSKKDSQFQASGDLKEESSLLDKSKQNVSLPITDVASAHIADDDSQEFDEQYEDEGEFFDPVQYEETVGKKELQDFQADEQVRQQAAADNQREVGGTADTGIPAAVSSSNEKPKSKRRRRHRRGKKHSTNVEQDSSDQPQQRHTDRALLSEKLK